MKSTPEPFSILENSRVLFDSGQVAAVVDKMAREINEFYGDKPIVMISVLHSGMQKRSCASPQIAGWVTRSDPWSGENRGISVATEKIGRW